MSTTPQALQFSAQRDYRSQRAAALIQANSTKHKNIPVAFVSKHWLFSVMKSPAWKKRITMPTPENWNKYFDLSAFPFLRVAGGRGGGGGRERERERERNARGGGGRSSGR